MSQRKVIIVNYYGKLPVYASYFFDSCKTNLSYEFVLFNDLHEDQLDQNIRFVKSTLQDFNKRATETLGIPIQLDRGFKVCDLRPAYGVIYADLIKDFDFWGFCDLDIILGDLNHFLPDDVLEKTDVYSSKPLWNSGSFSLYRNTAAVNTLFQLTDDWQSVFTSNRYFGFDECVQRWDGKPVLISERTNEMLSIYDLVHSSSEIRYLYTDTVIEWPKDIKKLKWSNGKWVNQVTGVEFMYFHLLLMKNSWRFYQPKLNFSKEIFVTGLGLSEGDHDLMTIHAIVWRLKRAGACLPGIAQSLRKKFF